MSNNRKFLISGGEEGEVRVWEIRTREMVVNLKQHTMRVTSVQLYDDDSHVFTASRDRMIYLWDLRAEERQKGLVQRTGAAPRTWTPRACAISPKTSPRSSALGAV